MPMNLRGSGFSGDTLRSTSAKNADAPSPDVIVRIPDTQGLAAFPPRTKTAHFIDWLQVGSVSVKGWVNYGAQSLTHGRMAGGSIGASQIACTDCLHARTAERRVSGNPLAVDLATAERAREARTPRCASL
jgi:hypothetical protein